MPQLAVSLSVRNNYPKLSDSIAHTLCTRFGPETSEAAQLGLIDMLLARPDRPRFRAELRARLRIPGSPLTVFRYLAVVLAASRRRELVAEVIATVEAERDPQRLTALAEALALLPGDREATRALELAQTRMI